MHVFNGRALLIFKIMNVNMRIYFIKVSVKVIFFLNERLKEEL